MKNLKSKLRSSFPGGYKYLKDLFYSINRVFTGKKQQEVIFEKIYRTNSWMDKESKSGSGSNLQNTASVRKELPLLIKELEIKTLLDIPCGDFYWMKEIKTDIDLYIGGDIVADIIEDNRKKYENEKRKFMIMDITADNLPESDLILCRDCLPHLSYKNIFAALKQLKKSGSKYLLTSTYIKQEQNRDIETGMFQRLNLQLPPFNFPEPMKLIEDKCIDERLMLEDKMLGLWKIEDL